MIRVVYRQNDVNVNGDNDLRIMNVNGRIRNLDPRIDIVIDGIIRRQFSSPARALDRGRAKVPVLH
jgi:hypothetical protein